MKKKNGMHRFKTDDIVTEMNNVKIAIKQVNLSTLRKNTLTNVKRISLRHNNYDSIYDVEESTMHKWEINYIKHDLCNYDRYWRDLKRANNYAYFILQRRTLEKIKAVYPHLSQECDRQLEALFARCPQYYERQIEEISKRGLRHAQ